MSILSVNGIRVFGVLALLLGSVFAQPSPGSESESGQALKVDALFKQLDRSSPGCAVGVMNSGEVIYSRGFGMASLQLGVPITLDLVFPVNSISKQFTAMAVVLLSVQKKLSLQDDIHKYVPELQAYPYPVTIDELLHQTSGLKDYDVLLTVAGSEPEFHETQEMVFDILRRQSELNFTPGSQYMYSNTNYFLLGLIVERLSGKSLAAFAQQEIFGPLGMTRSRYRGDSEIIPGRVSTYVKTSDGLRVVDDHRGVIGAGGVDTTIGDLAKWDRNFYDAKVGGREALELMLKRQKLTDGSWNDYLAGLENTTYRGLPVVEHAGDGYGSQSNIMRFPDQHFTAVVLCNVRNQVRPSELTRKIADIYLDGQFKDAEAANGKQALASPQLLTSPQDFVGLYWDGKTEGVYRVELKDGKLTILELPFYPDFPAVDLTYLGGSQFRDNNDTYILQNANHQDIVRSAVAVTNPRTITLFRVADAEASPQAMGELAKSFYSGDLDATWKFVMKRDRLVLERKGFPDEVLEPAFRDAFFCDAAIGIIHFTRDGQGGINGVDAINHRLFRIHFTKQD
jgi:CubicO group peptidase (beta-lactamase class C family)